MGLRVVTTRTHYTTRGVIEVTTEYNPDERLHTRWTTLVDTASGDRASVPVDPFDADQRSLVELWIAAGMPPRRRVGSAGFNWSREDLVEALRGMRKAV